MKCKPAHSATSPKPAKITPRFALVALCFSATASAGGIEHGPALNAPQDRMPALVSAHDGDLWSLALLGPAAMLLLVGGLGLTVTLRSLRGDVRRSRALNHYWQQGAQARAAAAN
jgi:hypothetical protein